MANKHQSPRRTSLRITAYLNRFAPKTDEQREAERGEAEHRGECGKVTSGILSNPASRKEQYEPSYHHQR